jgi:hypothetical protein
MNTKTLIAALNWAQTVETGAKMDSKTLWNQIGGPTVLAISGGRAQTIGSTVLFPVSNGYQVAVTLTSADDYTVRRIFIRGGEVTVKAEAAGVYAENVGEVAYRMSCFENVA